MESGETGYREAAGRRRKVKGKSGGQRTVNSKVSPSITGVMQSDAAPGCIRVPWQPGPGGFQREDQAERAQIPNKCSRAVRTSSSCTGLSSGFT